MMVPQWKSQNHHGLLIKEAGLSLHIERREELRLRWGYNADSLTSYFAAQK